MSPIHLLTNRPKANSLIGVYPEFTNINISHKPVFDQFAQKYGHYSDFNFISLFSWNTKGDTKISMLNNNLVISMPDYLTGETCCSIIGANKIDKSLNELLAKTKKLKLVPDVVVKNIKKTNEFIIEEDPNNHDYVYSVSDLISLEGKKYKHIRNKISNFNREFPDYNKLQVTATSIVDINRFNNFHDVFYRWSSGKALAFEEFVMEDIAIHSLLEHSNKFNLLIVEIWLGNALVAFSVNEIVAPGFAITHFEKALKIHKYFNTYVVQQTALMLSSFGCKKVNWEQDLGLPGLRQSKTCYYPTEMLNKYQVRLKT